MAASKCGHSLTGGEERRTPPPQWWYWCKDSRTSQLLPSIFIGTACWWRLVRRYYFLDFTEQVYRIYSRGWYFGFIPAPYIWVNTVSLTDFLLFRTLFFVISSSPQLLINNTYFRTCLCVVCSQEIKAAFVCCLKKTRSTWKRWMAMEVEVLSKSRGTLITASASHFDTVWVVLVFRLASCSSLLINLEVLLSVLGFLFWFVPWCRWMNLTQPSVC